MPKVKRFRLHADDHWRVRACEEEDGRWVKWEDVERLIDALEEARSRGFVDEDEVTS